MILCERGIHYFDSEKHSDCPYCKRIAEGRGGDPTAGASPSDLKSSPGGVGPTEGAAQAFQRPGQGREPTVSKGKTPHIDRSATSPWYSEEEGQEIFEPVVGWLVAVEGPARGRDFRLKPGRNLIGRSMEAEICIEDDDLMSREHSNIYYYGEINNFYIEDNRSKHGTFLMPNKEIVVERRPVKDGDIVKIGRTVFLLKTLCNEDFKWEE
jgi:hypothetical protein